MDEPQFITTTKHGRVVTVDGAYALEIQPVVDVNKYTGTQYRQHNIMLVNGQDEPVLVGAYNTRQDAEEAYEHAASQPTLADALAVLDDHSLHLYHLHFSEPIDTNWNLPQHYIGCTEDLDHRLHVHRNYSNVPIVRRAIELGFELEVAKVWIGGWAEERKAKAQRNGRKSCPICKEAKK